MEMETGKGKEQGQQATIQVKSLREAMHDALSIGGGGHLSGVRSSVVVEQVEVDQATALVSLLHSQTNVWVPVNLKQLKRVCIVDRLLTIAGSAILPIPVESPFNKLACQELRRYAFRVKDCARIVGGSFDTEAGRVADHLLNHVNQVNKLPLVALPSLVGNAEDVRKRITKFRRSSFTLSMGYHFDSDGEEFDWHAPGALPPRGYHGTSMEAPAVRVTSLRQLMEVVLQAGRDSCNIVVASVHVRHSESLQEVLLHQALRRGWSVVNDVRVKHLTVVDQLLVTIAVAILPDLCEYPTNEVCCNSLYVHIDKIKVNSEGVGGSFNIEAIGLADRLFSHAYDISLHPLVTETWLADNAKQLIVEITHFRSRQVTLSEEA